MVNTDENKDVSIEKFVWKKSYTWVLLLNIGYIVLFYFLMNYFS